MRRLREVTDLLPGGPCFRDEVTLAESRVASLRDSLAPPLQAVAGVLANGLRTTSPRETHPQLASAL